MKRSALVLVVLVIAAAVPAFSQAVVDEAQRLSIRGVPDQWGFRLGGYWQTFDTKVRLDGSDGETGTDINFESDFDLPDNQATYNLSGFYRFTDRSRLDLTYTGWSRDRSVTLEEQIEWGDVIYDVGATLESDTSGELINVIYRYSFYNNGHVMFGVNGGISALLNDITLTGEGHVDGGGTVSGTLAESTSTIFPIPVIGVHFEWTLTERLFWEGSGNFFAASVSDYDGNVQVINTSLNYYFTENIGVGVGYARTSYKVAKELSNGGEVDVRFGFGGPVAYGTFSF